MGMSENSEPHSPLKLIIIYALRWPGTLLTPLSFATNQYDKVMNYNELENLAKYKIPQRVVLCII